MSLSKKDGAIESSYRQAMAQLRKGADLSCQESEAAMNAILEERITPIQAGAFLTALAMKGEKKGELIGLAKAIRAKAEPLKLDPNLPLLDTCGTGGSGLPTTNISTMNAFLLAAAGIKVVKHGNRASSGRFGSADLLEALGIDLMITPEKAGQLLQEVGIAFLFAPQYHPALKYVAPVRQQLGFATIFNFLGPLCNPARPKWQLLGTSSRQKAPIMTEALLELGIERALLLHGEVAQQGDGAAAESIRTEGLDELTLTGPTHLWEVRDGQIRQFKFELSEIGLQALPYEAIAGGDRDLNCQLFEELLSGRKQGPYAYHLQLNAAAGLYIAGKVPSIAQGYEAAAELLTSGKAMELFERYRAAAKANQ